MDIFKKIFCITVITILTAQTGYTYSQSGNAYAQTVAIVINKNNPLNDVSHKELRRIFRIEKLFWADSSKIYVIMREAGSAEKEVVLKSIYKMDKEQLKQYWIKQIFREKMTSFPKAFRSDRSIKQFVQTVPNAIGFINANNVDQSVKVLKVNGKLPGDEQYPIVSQN